MTQRPLGAQISAMLADRGVTTIFGIPGVHNIELYRGLEDSGLRHVLARHEQGSALWRMVSRVRQAALGSGM